MELTNANKFLANIIMIFHILVIIFILLAPFSNNSSMLILHIVFSISLLTHWYSNNDLCSLTLIEGKLRGVEYNNGFIHKFVSPMYNLHKTDWNTVCYTLTILLMLISMYRLYKSKKIKEFLECIEKTKNQIKKDNDINKLSFYNRINMYLNCLNVFNTI